jgi:hypothetical protein
MKSLPDKLGYRPATQALLHAVPDSLSEALAPISEGEPPAFILAFVRSAAVLVQVASDLGPLYRPGGHLWIAYPKKSGAIRSDLTRDHGWEPIAALGLLGVTQIALDADWSAMRFRFRDEIKVLKRRSEQA